MYGTVDAEALQPGSVLARNGMASAAQLAQLGYHRRRRPSSTASVGLAAAFAEASDIPAR